MGSTGKRKLYFILFGAIFVSGIIAYFGASRIKFSVKVEETDQLRAEEDSKRSQFSKGAEEHFKKGHELLREKKLNEALKEFELAAKISPDTPIAHYWVGMAYFYDKDFQKSIAKFKKTIELDPRNYHAYAMIGKILSFDKAKLDDAILNLEKALNINSDYSDAHFDLGRIFALRGDMNRATAEFAFIFRSEPQFAMYHFEFGRILESIRNKDGAKKEYERALQLNPDLNLAKEALAKLNTSSK
jgi:tetratricopeptide (TPR) repeat protein